MKPDELAKIQAEMNGKQFLYEVHFSEHGSRSFGTVAADTDIEAVAYAKRIWPKAVFVQRDHWGHGPKIYLGGAE